MAQGVLEVLVAAGLGLVVAAVVGRWLTRNTGSGRIMARLEQLQAEVDAWQAEHRQRIRELERRLTDIEVSVSCAEDDAGSARFQLMLIQGDLLRRLEEVEQRMEIQLLVDQGRIPRQHLS